MDVKSRSRKSRKLALCNDLVGHRITPFGGTRARSHVSLRIPHVLHFLRHRGILRSRSRQGQNSSLPYQAGQSWHVPNPSCSTMKDRQWNPEVICIFALYAAPTTYADSYICYCRTRLTKLCMQAWNASWRLSSLTHTSYRLHSSSYSYSTCFLQ